MKRKIVKQYKLLEKSKEDLIIIIKDLEIKNHGLVTQLRRINEITCQNILKTGDIKRD